jgi:hypothetical protein
MTMQPPSSVMLQVQMRAARKLGKVQPHKYARK